MKAWVSFETLFVTPASILDVKLYLELITKLLSSSRTQTELQTSGINLWLEIRLNF